MYGEAKNLVVPAKAGTQRLFLNRRKTKALGPGFRRDDEVGTASISASFNQ